MELFGLLSDQYTLQVEISTVSQEEIISRHLFLRHLLSISLKRGDGKTLIVYTSLRNVVVLPIRVVKDTHA